MVRKDANEKHPPKDEGDQKDEAADNNNGKNKGGKNKNKEVPPKPAVSQVLL